MNNIIVDLHSHTKYSHCGRDEPEELVKKMIEKGVRYLGITDHNYGIRGRMRQYYEEISALKMKYASKAEESCRIVGN